MAFTRARGSTGDFTVAVSVMLAPLLHQANANGFGVASEAFGFGQQSGGRA
jgi:hypothetical protein